MLDYAETVTAERMKRVIDDYGEGDKAVAGLSAAPTRSSVFQRQT